MTEELASSAVHARRLSNEERALELARDEEFVRRRGRWLLLQTLGCVLCCAAGVYLVGWALHARDPGWGAIFSWAGLLLGDVGMCVLLLRHHARTVGDGF